MIKTERNIASFVLRFTQDLWQDAGGSPRVRWRGHIRYVQGNREDRFTDFAEAVTFMQRNLAELTLDAISGKNMNQEDTLRESFKFWEDFSAVYSGMMFEAMEQSLKQSEAVKQQMQDVVEQTIKAWPFPATSSSNSGSISNQDVVNVLYDLQRQVKVLSEKVETLEVALEEQKK
jgi:hypothetical protein